MEPWDGAGDSNIPPPASPVVYAAPAPPSGFRHRFSREDDDEIGKGLGGEEFLKPSEV